MSPREKSIAQTAKEELSQVNRPMSEPRRPWPPPTSLTGRVDHRGVPLACWVQRAAVGLTRTEREDTGTSCAEAPPGTMNTPHVRLSYLVSPIVQALGVEPARSLKETPSGVQRSLGAGAATTQLELTARAIPTARTNTAQYGIAAVLPQPEHRRRLLIRLRAEASHSRLLSGRLMPQGRNADALRVKGDNPLARPSSDDLQHATNLLMTALADGHLSWSEYEDQLNQVFAVETLAELRALLVALPVPSRGLVPARPSGARRTAILVSALALVLVVALLVAVAVSDGHRNAASGSTPLTPTSTRVSSTPTSGPELVPAGDCIHAPVSLGSPAGSPSMVAGKTSASVADTLLKYASDELNPDALYYRLQNVTPAEGTALLPSPVQALGSRATHVTTATLMTPGGYDDNLAVFRFSQPAQATTLLQKFWVMGCAQQTHVDVFKGAVAAYLSVTAPGSTNFSTDVVVDVGRYAIVYGLPGQLPASTTQPMAAQIVGALESPNISSQVDISNAIGPVAG